MNFEDATAMIGAADYVEEIGHSEIAEDFWRERIYSSFLKHQIKDRNARRARSSVDCNLPIALKTSEGGVILIWVDRRERPTLQATRGPRMAGHVGVALLNSIRQNVQEIHLCNPPEAVGMSIAVESDTFDDRQTRAVEAVEKRRLMKARMIDEARVSEPVSSPQTVKVNAAKVWGKVIEHTDISLIIRFDNGGMEEEREYFWRDLSVKPEDIPIETEVIGCTELLMSTKFEEIEDSPERIEEVRRKTKEFLESQELNGEIEMSVMPPAVEEKETRSMETGESVG